MYLYAGTCHGTAAENMTLVTVFSRGHAMSRPYRISINRVSACEGEVEADAEIGVGGGVRAGGDERSVGLMLEIGS